MNAIRYDGDAVYMGEWGLLTIGMAYHRGGFFNETEQTPRFPRPDDLRECSITLECVGSKTSESIEGKVRYKNKKGKGSWINLDCKARIYGGIRLVRWLGDNIMVGEQVRIEVIEPLERYRITHLNERTADLPAATAAETERPEQSDSRDTPRTKSDAESHAFGIRSAPSVRKAEPGILLTDRIDFNQPVVVSQLLEEFRRLSIDLSHYVSLQVSRIYYFASSDVIPNEAGWYVILTREGAPLYAGQADNLNSRLNSNSGSLDQFASSKRTSEPARNFIKTFTRMNQFSELRAFLVTESQICSALGIEPPLSGRDRHNIEKFFNMCKSMVAFRA